MSTWILYAINDQGASAEYQGSSKQEALAQFDRAYYRKGFTLTLVNHSTGKKVFVKKTFR